MDITKLLAKIWPQWKIVRLIGRGNSSTVYEIENSIQGHAALKVIEIPQDETEIMDLRNSGLDEISVRAYFNYAAENLLGHLNVISKLKAVPNIVPIDDCYYMRRKDKPGGIILIRTQLLKSLTEYMAEQGIHDLSKAQTVRMGINIATALKYIHSEGIIHKDVKPENIMVDELGTFKLGDLGTVRELAGLGYARAASGNDFYIAPEERRGERCSESGDIYSLGIIMYRCLNNGRAPFLPEHTQIISPDDVNAAQEARLSGAEPMKSPENADEALGAIILRACAFDPRDRYQSPDDLLEALQAYGSASDENIYDDLIASGNGAALALAEHSAKVGRRRRASRAVESESEVQNDIPLSRSGAAPDGVQGQAADNGSDRQEQGKKPEKRRRSKGWIPAALLLLAGGGACACFYWLYPYSLNVIDGSGAGKFKPGTVVTCEAQQQEGTSFEGWIAAGMQLTDEQRAEPVISFEMPRKNVELAAMYDTNSYKLEVIGAEGSGTYEYGSEITLQAQEREGQAFLGWSSEEGAEALESAAQYTFTMPAHDLTLHTQYGQNSYSLTVDGSVTEYEYGADVTLIAEKKEGQEFTGWTVGAGETGLTDEQLACESITFRMPAQNVELSSGYSKNTYSLIVLEAEGSGTYAYGDEVVLHAPDREGYMFNEWKTTDPIGDADLYQQDIRFTMPGENVTIEATYRDPSITQVGDVITLGVYEQDSDYMNGPEPIEWKVLAVENGRALLISAKGFCVEKYNNELTSATWSESHIRKWLNDTFFPAAFGDEEIDQFTSTINNNVTAAGTADDTEDMIFLLSASEVEKYMPDPADRICKLENRAIALGALHSKGKGGGLWWLRDSGENGFAAAFVNAEGEINREGAAVNNGTLVVRPAMWVIAQ